MPKTQSLASATPSQSDPWAWAQWAAQQDPGTYNLGGGRLTDDPNLVKTAGPALRRAGLWNPSWDAWANYQEGTGESGGSPHYGAEPDFSSLSGYELQNTRGPGNSAFLQLRDPSGKQLDLEQYEQSGSWKSKDYIEIAAVAAAMAGGGMMLNGGFAGAGAAAADPIGAYLTTGAVEGSTLGGIGGGASGAVGAGSAAASLASAAPGAAPASALDTLASKYTAAEVAGAADKIGTATSLGGAAAKAIGGAMNAGDWINLAGLGFGVANALNPPDAPDTSGLNAAAAANSDIAKRQQDLAEKQYADTKAIYDEYAPLFKQQAEASIAAQTKSTAQSDAQWADYLQTWKPVEQQLASRSLEMASPGRIDQEGQRAAADASGQFERARQETRRSLEMSGASPEKIAALEASGRLAEAKGVAGATYQGRSGAESKAMAYLDNASRFGRNMPSTGIATAALAGQQGQQAQSAAGNNLSAVTAPGQAAAPLLNNAVSSNNSVGNLLQNAASMQYQGDMNAFNQRMGLAQGLARFSFTSSEKAKDIEGEVDGKQASDAVEKSGSVKWRYKNGMGDGSRALRMGPTAESLAAAAPGVSDGKTVDGISMLGLQHAAIGNHAQRLRRLEKALTLADAEVA